MDFRQELYDLLWAKGSDIGPELVVCRAIILFAAAIFYVRIAKKRFMAQGSAMDLVMVVIFGSTLSRGINGGTSLVSALLAGIVMVILQRLISHLSSRSRKFGSWVKGSKAILVRDGQIDWEAMRHHDITEHDLLQEMRSRVLTEDISTIKLAVLERNGHVGFVRATEMKPAQ